MRPISQLKQFPEIRTEFFYGDEDIDVMMSTKIRVKRKGQYWLVPIVSQFKIGYGINDNSEKCPRLEALAECNQAFTEQIQRTKYMWLLPVSKKDIKQYLQLGRMELDERQGHGNKIDYLLRFIKFM